MTWSGHVANMGEIRNAYNILVGKPEGKRALRRPRHRREVLREIVAESVDWIHPAQDRDWKWDVMNAVMNLRIP
jgi:hypothetical protein